MSIYMHISDQTQAIDAGIFLSQFDTARDEMRRASDQFLRLANVLQDKERAKHYRKLHKRMVRLRKQWSLIEHDREIDLPEAPRQPGGPSCADA